MELNRQGWRLADLTGAVIDVNADGGATVFAEFTSTAGNTPTLIEGGHSGSSMPSLDTLAAVQKKRKRSRRSSNGSLTSKNQKLTEEPLGVAALKDIGKNIKGKRIEAFIVLEGGISLVPLDLAQNILQDVLKAIDGSEKIDEGT